MRLSGVVSGALLQNDARLLLYTLSLRSPETLTLLGVGQTADGPPRALTLPAPPPSWKPGPLELMASPTTCKSFDSKVHPEGALKAQSAPKSLQTGQPLVQTIRDLRESPEPRSCPSCSHSGMKGVQKPQAPARYHSRGRGGGRLPNGQAVFVSAGKAAAWQHLLGSHLFL
ncbi:hypothetical protein JEQ12_011775 [Ovis aries]|uniref:Uncharacterized protein n=1 Tax=Ovis aries TaxID=9940 RepID=A0A835ZP07_SHEEP|nr:hypothetical protein JEQ12_011775 [Ovis aries]